MNETKLQTGIYEIFSNLLYNYNPSVKMYEEKNSSEIQEEQALLNELMDTVTMRKTFEILKSYNWLLDLQDFKSKFNTLWFDLYDRDGDSRKTTLG